MSKLSRRSLVATAAALPALAVPAAIATAASCDDTLERIAEHRRIYRVIDEILDRREALEEVLPKDRRKAFSSIEDRGTDVGRHDDPRWTTVQAELWTARDRKDEIAWSFVDRPPTTIEGVAAILAYGEEYEEAGDEWPMYRFRFTAAGAYAGKTEEDWRRSLNRAIVPALRSAPIAAGVSAMPKAGDVELLRLIAQARSLWASNEACFANHDETVETYEQMEERSHGFAIPFYEQQTEISLICPLTDEGLKAKAEFALDCGFAEEAEETEKPILAVVHDVARRKFELGDPDEPVLLRTPRSSMTKRNLRAPTLSCSTKSIFSPRPCRRQWPALSR
jgi:hypothetical protein